MGWMNHPKQPWNWDARGQMVFVTVSAFLQFVGALLIWLVLYDMEGNGEEFDIAGWFSGIVGLGVFVAGAMGSGLMVLVGAGRYFRSLLYLLGIRRHGRNDAVMLPWIASIASFIFGTFLITSVANRPLYFRDEILGLLATLLVAFAASSRAIEAFTGRNEGSEEE